MPRYKGHFPGNIANLKKNATDIIFDFVLVYNFLADYFDGYLDSSHIKDFKNTAKKLAKIKPSKPAYSNRIYITTNITHVSFMAVDFDEPVLEHLKYVCQLIEHEVDKDLYDGNYYSQLWVFEDAELSFHAIVSPKTVAKLVSVFYAENLINIGAFRDSWIGEARRRWNHN